MPVVLPFVSPVVAVFAGLFWAIFALGKIFESTTAAGFIKKMKALDEALTASFRKRLLRNTQFPKPHTPRREWPWGAYQFKNLSCAVTLAATILLPAYILLEQHYPMLLVVETFDPDEFASFMHPFLAHWTDFSTTTLVTLDCLLIFVLFPYSSVAVYVQEQLLDGAPQLFKKIRSFVIFFAWFTLILVAGAILIWMLLKMPFLQSAFLFIAPLFFVLSMVFLFIQICYFAVDYYRLRVARRSLPANRRQIATALGSFATRWGRSAYVQWLWRRAADLDASMRRPGNGWPDSTRPNYEDDAASVLIARLDERWLNLAR
jgi:hypothetical protein